MFKCFFRLTWRRPEQDVKLFAVLCVSPCRGKFARLPEPRDFKVTDILRPSVLDSVCLLGPNPSVAEVLFQPKTYELPDGNIFTVGIKRFRSAGVLFPAKSHQQMINT